MGLHLIIDGMTEKKLTEKELVRFTLLVTSPEGINMNIICGPAIVKVNGGVECFTIIAESHIILKAYDDGRLGMEVFSCREFDTEIPIRLAKEQLGLKDRFNSWCLDRVGVED